jgi:uncharacterized protein YcaQ
MTPAQATETLLEHEFLQEKASALGRLGSALERTLAALRRFDAAHAHARGEAHARDMRRVLVAEAGHALWLFIVQREACGLRDARQVMRDYRVPAEVFAGMGAYPPQTARPGAVGKYG